MHYSQPQSMEWGWFFKFQVKIQFSDFSVVYATWLQARSAVPSLVCYETSQQMCIHSKSIQCCSATYNRIVYNVSIVFGQYFPYDYMYSLCKLKMFTVVLYYWFLLIWCSSKGRSSESQESKPPSKFLTRVRLCNKALMKVAAPARIPWRKNLGCVIYF